nr:hypothetical protein Iba_chr04dCG13370 [Ipomoea batatas]
MQSQACKENNVGSALFFSQLVKPLKQASPRNCVICEAESRSSWRREGQEIAGEEFFGLDLLWRETPEKISKILLKRFKIEVTLKTEALETEWTWKGQIQNAQGCRKGTSPLAKELASTQVVGVCDLNLEEERMS